MGIVKYMDWEFLVDQKLTIETYENVLASGADECVCGNCKNYVANRELVFPEEIKELFRALGVDYRREVEVFSYEMRQDGTDHIGGWFHFKGLIVSGNESRIPLPDGGYQLSLAELQSNFSIGFAAGNNLTYFEDNTGLVQIEFEAVIPWLIDEASQNNQ